MNICFVQQTPEHITTENEEFISEVVAESYSSPLALEPWPRGEWDAKSQRCGVIGVKLGCYPMWRKDGTSLLTTILHVSAVIISKLSNISISNFNSTILRLGQHSCIALPEVAY